MKMKNLIFLLLIALLGLIATPAAYAQLFNTGGYVNNSRLQGIVSSADLIGATEFTPREFRGWVGLIEPNTRVSILAGVSRVWDSTKTANAHLRLAWELNSHQLTEKSSRRAGSFAAMAFTPYFQLNIGNVAGIDSTTLESVEIAQVRVGGRFSAFGVWDIGNKNNSLARVELFYDFDAPLGKGGWTGSAGIALKYVIPTGSALRRR